jgi:hypothetical protein
LLGQTNTEGGESRRNENIQFNLIDNNALKELNIRLGTTATLIEEFKPNRNYFGAEFGNSPSSPLHVTASGQQNFHGRLHVSHQNSVFSARSFFQAGDAAGARERLRFRAGRSCLAVGKFLPSPPAEGSWHVNGNVLGPRATAHSTDERSGHARYRQKYLTPILQSCLIALILRHALNTN